MCRLTDLNLSSSKCASKWQTLKLVALKSSKTCYKKNRKIRKRIRQIWSLPWLAFRKAPKVLDQWQSRKSLICAWQPSCKKDMCSRLSSSSRDEVKVALDRIDSKSSWDLSRRELWHTMQMQDLVHLALKHLLWFKTRETGSSSSRMKSLKTLK